MILLLWCGLIGCASASIWFSTKDSDQSTDSGDKTTSHYNVIGLISHGSFP